LNFKNGEKIKHPKLHYSVPVRGIAKNSQWKVLGWRRQRQGDLEVEPPMLGDFFNFSIKRMHFYAYFGQNSYFKA